MMYNYPFFGFPSFRRNYYYPYYNSHNINTNYSQSTSFACSPNNCSDNKSKKNNYSEKNIHNDREDCKISSDCDDSDEIFEIFGIKLHSDDLLILALLFFLYKEDVKDIYLYISLILLLLG